MARIAVIPDDAWDGEFGELHPRVVDPTYRRVDHILAIHSLNPRSMAAHQGLYESAMAGTATQPQPTAKSVISVAVVRAKDPWPPPTTSRILYR